MITFKRKIIFFIILVFFATLIFSFWIFYFPFTFQKEKTKDLETESFLAIFKKSFSEISFSFKEIFFQIKNGIEREIEKENIIRDLSNQVLKKLEEQKYEKKEK